VKHPVILETRESPVSLEVTKRELFYVIQQGPRGEPGANGTGVAHVHEQLTPSSLWIINHNLGVVPALISVMDNGGNVVNVGIEHPTPNQTRITCNPPMSGIARLL
jgi:hypothetical protein